MTTIELVVCITWFVTLVNLAMVMKRREEIKLLQKRCDAFYKQLNAQTKLLNERDKCLEAERKLIDDLVEEHLRVCERLDMLEQLEKERQKQ